MWLVTGMGLLSCRTGDPFPDGPALIAPASRGSIRKAQTVSLALKERVMSRIIGVSDHGGWAVLVTAAGDGTLLDRRRVELVDEGLPKRFRITAKGRSLPIHEAAALVERVRVSAEGHAKLRLDDVAMTVPGRILGVALRQCPALPPTITERIQDYRAQNVADWVMYRKALAGAATGARLGSPLVRREESVLTASMHASSS